MTAAQARISDGIRDRVLAAMWQKRITERELARRIGRPRAELAGLLEDPSPITVSDVMLIAEGLGVSVRTLLYPRAAGQ